jgi:hypothetical protein
MALSRENLSVARTNSGADVFCLTDLLSDDNLFRHVGLVWENKFDGMRTYSEHQKFASCLLKCVPASITDAPRLSERS